MGFALETDNEIENAKQKIQNKNLDSIALNSLQDQQAGFRGAIAPASHCREPRCRSHLAA